jgi:hypothetical protein
MKFKSKDELLAWQLTSRTHEECCGCKYQYKMPTPCGSGHAHGENPCDIKEELENPLLEPVGYVNPDHFNNYMFDGMDSTRIWKEKGCNGISMPVYAEPPANFQDRVRPWLFECFGEKIAGDIVERNHRFLEESLELVQSLGCTQSDAHQLVDYVYSRPVGEPYQEVGGVMVTLAALCLANNLNMHENGETELASIWTKIEKIRAKQSTKTRHSPLP